MGGIYAINADGTGRINLTTTLGFSGGSPDFSPDGTKIAFQCEGDVYVMNADGTGVTNLTNNLGFEPFPTPIFSPDGTKIAFTRHAGEFIGTKIFVMNTDESTQTQLTLGSHSHRHPSWQALPDDTGEDTDEDTSEDTDEDTGEAPSPQPKVGYNSISCEGGEDSCSGSRKRDFITGSNQSDTVLAKRSSDIIHVEGDGVADTVNCGRGDDEVLYEEGLDTVSPNCETQHPA